MSFNNPEEEVEVEADSASDSICINAKDKEQQQGEERAGAKVKDKKQSVSVSNSNSNSNNKSNINSNSNSNNPRQRQSSGSGNGKTKGDGHFSLATGANRNPVGSRHQHQHPHNRRLLLRQSSSSSFRQLGSHLRRQSSLLVDSLHSQLPATPTGWAVSTTALASLVLQYELNLQDKLTAPPHVFCQVRDTLAAAVAGIDAAAAAAATVAAGDTTCLTYGAGGMNDKMERLYQKLAHPRDCGCQDPDGPSMQQQQQPQSQQHQQGIFTRDIKPSLVIGSRGLFSSTAAYIMGDRSGNNTAHRVRRCREIMKMGADGALIALDWEIPVDDYENNHENHVNHRNSNNNNSNNNNSNDSNSNGNTPDQPPKHIDKPLVLLLHGMNNDSSFGYIRSMMRTATSRGWMACAINMRGQGGVELTTPRAYNAGFTGDLRGVILQLEKRLVRSKTTTSTTTRRKRERCAGTRENDTVDTDSNANSNANANANASANASANEKEKQGTTGPDPEPTIPDQDDDCTDDNTHEGGPIFLLGYSLGANLITKYLGEESLHGTLPKCIAGGAAMGNPLHIHSGSIAFPWNMLLAAGIKRTILQNYNTLRRFREPNYQAAVKKALMSRTIAQLDDSFSRYLIRNEGRPPYEMKLGYDGGGEEYWRDASSHRCVAHVSVPLLKISAQDDFLVFGQFAKKLNHCLENPNVIVVKTRCGGHLGWQESPPLPSVNKGGGKGGGGKGAGWFGGTGSWSDVAVADFIEALLQIREEDRQKKEEKKEKTRMLEMVAGGFRQDDDNGDGDGDGNFATTSIRNERKVLNDPISARQSKIVSRL